MSQGRGGYSHKPSDTGHGANTDKPTGGPSRTHRPGWAWALLLPSSRYLYISRWGTARAAPRAWAGSFLPPCASRCFCPSLLPWPLLWVGRGLEGCSPWVKSGVCAYLRLTPAPPCTLGPQPS